MAITRIQQYCPVATDELADGLALSSRIARDWTRQVNNMKSYACAPMLVLNNTYPGGRVVTHADTNENYYARWAPVPFPASYTNIRVVICGRVTVLGDSVIFRMYCDSRLYEAADPVAATDFSADAVSGSSTLGSTTDIVQAFTVSGYLKDLDLFETDFGERDVFLTMTAQAAVANDQSRIFNIAAWAMPTTF